MDKFSFLKNTNETKTPTRQAKNNECVIPLCPSTSKYSTPKYQPIKSKSGNDGHRNDNTQNLLFLLI